MSNYQLKTWQKVKPNPCPGGSGGGRRVVQGAGLLRAGAGGAILLRWVRLALPFWEFTRTHGSTK